MSSKDYDMLVTSRATQVAMRRLRVNIADGPVIKLSSYHHMICRSTMRGYSVDLKIWLEFYVSNITDISLNSNSLVSLPEGTENLISSFARARPKNANSLWTAKELEHQSMSIHILGQDSASRGITAKVIADRINIPLLTISPSDLGSSLLETESRLSEILELVHQWHTLLLLDGLDFLLEKSNSGFQLEDILSIVVHDLSNHDYKGPFFISTNREDDVYKALLSVSSTNHN
jgi:hypothetical protein